MTTFPEYTQDEQKLVELLKQVPADERASFVADLRVLLACKISLSPPHPPNLRE